MQTYIVLESIKMERQYSVIAANEADARATVIKGQAEAIHESEADERAYAVYTPDEFTEEWGYDVLALEDAVSGASR